MSTSRVGRAGLGAAGAVAVVTLVAACASSSSSGTPAGGGASGLKTRSTSIGTVLVDTSGRTVYELVGDSTSKPTCTGRCLAVWPAVKKNGHQVVVNGHPAYTYVRDTAAGQTKGQNVKDRWGLWLALGPNGTPIRGSGGGKSTAPASPSSSSKAAPGGGGPAF